MAEVIGRDHFERKLGARLGRLSARHRRQLLSLAGNPPDIRKVPETFWRRVREETEEEAAALLLLIFIASATQHGMAKGLAESYALRFAEGRASVMAQRIRDHAHQDILSGKEPFSDSRVVATAITETTTARTQGILAAAEEAGPTRDGQIKTDKGELVRDPVLVWELEVIRKVESHCLFCPLMHRTGREVWGRWVPTGPSAHVMCACGIIVMPPGTPTMVPTASDTEISRSAREAGVFGY